MRRSQAVKRGILVRDRAGIDARRSDRRRRARHRRRVAGSAPRELARAACGLEVAHHLDVRLAAGEQRLLVLRRSPGRTRRAT